MGDKAESGPNSQKADDVYEFKTTSAESASTQSTASSLASEQTGDKAGAKDDKKAVGQQAGDKRGHEDEDDETRKKKQRRDDSSSAGTAQSAGPATAKDKTVRSTRGGSTEKVLTTKVTKTRALAAADRKSPLSVSNSPKKPPSRDHSDDEDENSKKCPDSSGLKVPPLKIVLTNQGNGSTSGMSSTSPASAEESKKGSSGAGNSNEAGVSATGDQVCGTTSSSASSYTDYHVKKRKLRSQVEESNLAGSATGSNSVSNAGSADAGGKNGPAAVGACSGQASTAKSSSEPLNDIEKFLSIRRQVEQRRKNLFPVQPKPPQGFKDYLMNRKTYLLHENAHERLRSIPMIQPPPSLEGPLRDLFKAQEEERYRLRMKHLVEKEKLVLAVEQEILRVHGRAARALANQSLPFSVCTFLRDEEIYNPIDPQQEEKNRDVRSRYNGRLFLSWLQDVDDKWEKIKEQMVLRHHNEAESLNAVQKMDWEWKLKEMSGSNQASGDSLPPIDDLHIPMVHVSDDFDLDRS